MDSIRIGEHEWAAHNLSEVFFKDGTPILHAQSFGEWMEAAKSSTPAWCYVNNNSSNDSIVGKLYNRFVLNDPGAIIPDGWRLPTRADWLKLNDFLQNLYGKGFQKKMLSESGWSSYQEWKNFGDDDYRRTGKIINPNGDNETGLSIFPSGKRRMVNTCISDMSLVNRDLSNYEAGFDGYGSEANFWIWDKQDSGSPNENSSYVSYRSVENVISFNMVGAKGLGLSIRCIRS